MKHAIVFPFLVLSFGFPTFIFKMRSAPPKSPCHRIEIKTEVKPEVKKEVKQSSPSKYEQLFTYDNYFYKI